MTHPTSPAGRPAVVPDLRIRRLNDAPIRSEGRYVLYWMVAQRRLSWSFALDRAVDWARELGKPLLVFEALRCGYRWASDRLHAFVLQGMADHQAALAGSAVGYFPYLEEAAGAGSGLLESLAEGAAVVVTDDFPCFFLPRMVQAAGDRLPVLLEAVDSNGLLPLAATDRVFGRAVDFRRYLQKSLLQAMPELPRPDPLAGPPLPPFPGLGRRISERWPAAELSPDSLGVAALARLPIDHSVPPPSRPGGPVAATHTLESFLDERLGRYGEGRLNVRDRATSELSPYLHFGHLSVHEVFARVMEREGWNPGRLALRATASRSGFWGVGEAAESFLDELLTWRELGYGFTRGVPGYDRYESLPPWALKTLEEHLGDPREHVYDLATFEAAATHDELWNGAQRELLRDGRIHNYLRMLWGKKVLEWTAHPRDALAIMVELNNKYALDGRNPNSYSGIFWCLGRFDRAWGPERPIFGKVRYMSSEATRRKLDAKAYLREFGSGPAQRSLL